LSGDTLTCTTAAEHAIPTPTIDPSRAFNTKSYRIPEIQYTYDNFVKELQACLQSSYEIARSNLQVKKEKSKEYHDKTVKVPLFVVGDKVLLHDQTVRRGRSSKLSGSWIGPYEIISLDDVSVTLKLPRNRTLEVHANRLKPFSV
jgi:hypothetical protein